MNFMNEGCHYFQQKREILVSYQQVTWFLSCVLLWFLKHLSLVKVMCYAGTAWTHSSSLSLSLFLLQADSEVCGVEFAFRCIQNSLPCIMSEVW